jgi:hypothetical protein
MFAKIASSDIFVQIAEYTLKMKTIFYQNQKNLVMTHIKVLGANFFMFVFYLSSFSQCGEYLDNKYIADSCFKMKNYTLAGVYYEKCITFKEKKRVDYYYTAYSFIKLNQIDKALKVLMIGANNGLYYNKTEDFTGDTAFQRMYLYNSEWKIVGNKIKENTTNNLKKVKIDSMLLKNLTIRNHEDQKYRSSMPFFTTPEAKDSLWRIQKEIDIDNQQWLAKEIEKNGWPGIYTTGEAGDNMAWLIVQHADNDTAFQKKCLQLLKKLSLTNETNIHNVAYLEDRILINTNRKQIYGTQFENILKNGKTIDLILKPTEDLQCLNKRRFNMNLGPVEEYLNACRKRYVAK